MKYIHLIVSTVFLLFAIVQWNDPDSITWIIVYAIIAIVAFLAFKDQHYFYPNAVFTAVLLIGLLFYIPDFISWCKDGMPSIASEMKASSPYIEFVREFFGLLISLVAMTYYLTLSKKKRS